MDWLNRIKQVWFVLTKKPNRCELDLVADILEPNQYKLFSSQSLADQAHSIRVLHFLIKHGTKDNDLQIAALLHDVGKSLYHISLLERIVIVIVEYFFPHKVIEWGRGENFSTQVKPGWKRPFIIATKHPSWGAEMVSKTGVSGCVVQLINEHQNYNHHKIVNREGKLLEWLQIADRNS